MHVRSREPCPVQYPKGAGSQMKSGTMNAMTCSGMRFVGAEEFPHASVLGRRFRFGKTRSYINA